MKTTIATIRKHPLNKTFFKNASFHGDTSYAYNDARRELTVKMQVDGMKRSATWRVGTDGQILELAKR